MRLNYSILWIDDEQRRLNRIKKFVSEKNASVGIETNNEPLNAKAGPTEINRVNYIERLKSELLEKMQRTHPDLIVIDLHLSSVENIQLHGSLLIDYIRDDQRIYRPIIFYSGGLNNNRADALKQVTEDAYRSGVYGKSVLVCDFDNLENYLDGILNEMHSEEHKTNRIRGLLMDQVSEIDSIVTEIIRQIFQRELVPVGKREEAIICLRELVKNKVKQAQSAYNFVASQIIKFPALETNVVDISEEFDKIAEFISSERFLKKTDLASRLSFLKWFIETIEIDNDLAELFCDLENLDDKREPPSLVRIRNDFAHKGRNVLEQETPDDKIKYIREKCREHLINLQNIYQRIIPRS